MFKLLVPTTHDIPHNTDSKLVRAVPLSHCTVVLFFANGSAMTYNLSKKQIISQGKINQKAYLAKAITNSEICCTFVDSLSLCLLNPQSLNQKSITHLHHLPIPKSKNPQIDQEIFFLTQIEVFRKSGTFYLRQPHQTNQITIFYFGRRQPQRRAQFVQRSFNCTETVLEPVNEQSTIVAYKQAPKNVYRWDMKLFDLANNFKQQEYALQHASFVDKTFVQKVTQYQPGRYLIFANSMHKPFIIIFDSNINEVLDYGYQPQTTFSNLCLMNVDEGFMCLSYTFKDRVDGKFEDEAIDIVDIETGSKLDRKYGTLANIDQAWGRNYFLDWERDHYKTNTSTLRTWGVIGKQSMYMNLMRHARINTTYGQVLCQAILRTLE